MLGKKLLVALAAEALGLGFASAAVPTHGLVGYFNFENGFSNIAGALGSDVTGTFVNGSAITATGATTTPHTTGGYSGYDLFLNSPATLSGGMNVAVGYGAATPSTTNLGQNFTISLRFKSTAASGVDTSNRYFIYEGQTDYDASLSLDASAAGANTSPPTSGAPGSLHAYTDSSGTISYSTGPGAIAPDTWYNVIQTYDSTRVAGKTVITTYLDGVSIGSITNTNTANVSDVGINFGRARNGANNRGFDGNFDEVGLWDRVLTPSEIDSIASEAPELGAVFVIMMENHNWVQPTNKFTGSLQQIYQNPAAPYINSLVTVGHPNAAQSSWASNYTSVGVHPSEPNYIWAEAGTNFGVSNDNGPYGTGGNNQNTTSHFTSILTTLGESWMSYQEDIDLDYTTGAVLAQSSWTVPLTSKSGTLGGGATNPYNGGTHYNYQPKHNPPVFFTDTNGGNDATHANAQWIHYSPLQQLGTDLAANAVSIFNWSRRTWIMTCMTHSAQASPTTVRPTPVTPRRSRRATTSSRASSR